MNSIDLSQDRDQCGALVNETLDLCDPWKTKTKLLGLSSGENYTDFACRRS
jgi:hypothetical protein